MWGDAPAREKDLSVQPPARSARLARGSWRTGRKRTLISTVPRGGTTGSALMSEKGPIGSSASAVSAAARRTWT